MTILRGCAGMIEYPLLGGRAVRRNSSRTRGRLRRLFPVRLFRAKKEVCDMDFLNGRIKPIWQP